jgi:hypothetical protein
MFDLNAWHHALHHVTGTMALRWCRATAWDLQRWASELRAVAAAMEAAANHQQSHDPAQDRPGAAVGVAVVQLGVEQGRPLEKSSEATGS